MEHKISRSQVGVKEKRLRKERAHFSQQFNFKRFSRFFESGKMSGNTLPNSTVPTGVSLSSNEATVYGKLFLLADVTGKGAVSPSEAVTFLSKSKLSQEILGKVCLWI
jgi:hypothetical protein